MQVTRTEEGLVLRFEIKGKILGKESVRGRSFRLPQKTRDCINQLRDFFKEEVSEYGMDSLREFKGPVIIESCRFLFKGKKEGYYRKKPDIDNLEKTLYDSMSGVVFKDDSQVVEKRQVTKEYSNKDRCELVICLV